MLTIDDITYYIYKLASARRLHSKAIASIILYAFSIQAFWDVIIILNTDAVTVDGSKMHHIGKNLGHIMRMATQAGPYATNQCAKAAIISRQMKLRTVNCT